MTFTVRINGVEVGTVSASDIDEAMDLALTRFSPSASDVVAVSRA